MIFVSSCPPRPTNGTPVRSSSAPGASPKKHNRACGLPTPNTVCVRVLASSLQRVQPATCCCKTSSDSAPALGVDGASGASKSDAGVSTFKPDDFDAAGTFGVGTASTA